MDCNSMHTLMEENNDEKSTLTTENNFKQDCSYANEDRRIRERESRIEEFAEGFCGGNEK